MKKNKKFTLNQEIVLSCAMRYALGRMTYVVGSVCEELIANYENLNENTRSRISKEIQEYQDQYGQAGMSFDDDQWNKVKWLFDESNRVNAQANKYNTDEWVDVVAIKVGDKYYSIPDVSEYYKVREVSKV